MIEELKLQVKECLRLKMNEILKSWIKSLSKLHSMLSLEDGACLSPKALEFQECLDLYNFEAFLEDDVLWKKS